MIGPKAKNPLTQMIFFKPKRKFCDNLLTDQSFPGKWFSASEIGLFKQNLNALKASMIPVDFY